MAESDGTTVISHIEPNTVGSCSYRIIILVLFPKTVFPKITRKMKKKKVMR